MSKRTPAERTSAELAELAVLIDRVEAVMVSIPRISLKDYHRTAARRREALDRAAECLRDIGAVVSDTPIGSKIRLAGLLSTSTMDLQGAVVNWVRQASNVIRAAGGTP